MKALIAPEAADPYLQAEPQPSGARFALPTPRAAAVAVTGLLAFGVLLGSAVSPTAQSAAESPIIVAVSPPAAPTTPAPAPADNAADDTAVDSAPVEAAPAPTQQIIYVQEPQQTASTPPAPKPLPVPPLPPIPSVSHVFLVVLSGHGFNAAFGPDSKAPFLAKTLTTQGELIPNYYAVTHGGLANEVALISGQGPNPQIASNCPKYTDLTPGTAGDKAQATGDGCVFPAETKTLADQLFQQGNTWKAYVEDLGKAAGDQAQTCRHPELGADDPNHDATADNPYVTWRNPFLYFHSLIDNPTCSTGVADLSQLSTDLAQAGDVPALSYIVPNRCHDGSETVCVPDGPTGLAAADAWLQTVIPQIQQSPAYTQGGLIAITFDAAPADGPEADSSSCCGQPDAYPNMPPSDTPPSASGAQAQDRAAARPTASGAQAQDPAAQPQDPAAQPQAQTTPAQDPAAPSQDPAAAPQDPAAQPQAPATPPQDPAAQAYGVKATGGGGKVGLLLISPYIKPNTVNTTGYYNHFSLFASIEDLFNVGRIAYGNLPDLTTFDKSVYTAYDTSGG